MLLMNFQVLLLTIRVSISFENEEEKNQMLEFVSERISSIYAAFLRADWHATRDKDLRFFSFPHVFPLEEKVERFKVNLKHTIIKELNK